MLGAAMSREMPAIEPRAARLPASACFLALVLVTPGCAEEVGPEPGLYERCDIRDPACQERVFEGIQLERGVVMGGLPPIRVIDRATLRAELEEQASESSVPVPHLDAAYRLLALVPEDRTSAMASIDEQVARVAAFYRREQRDVTIVDRGAPMDLADDMAILAHELVHFIQDELYGIAAFYDLAESRDESFARVAVVEGDASYHEIAYALRIAEVDPRSVRWTDFYDDWLSRTLRSVRESDAPIHASRSLAYVTGANLLTRRRQDRGDPEAGQLWALPPRTSRELLFDRESGRGSAAAATGVSCPGSPAPPVETMALEHVITMGAIGVLAVLSTTDRDEDEIWRLARTVAGDRLSIYGDEDGATTALLWRIRLDSEDDARATHVALTTSPAWGAVVIDRAGDEVVLAGATEPALVSGWRARTSCE